MNNKGLMYSKEVDIDESTMPNIIYKYRNWKNQVHKTILTERKIYYPTPLQMEAVHELFFDMDFTRLDDKDLFYEYFYNSPLNKSLTPESKASEANFRLNNSPILKPENRGNLRELFRRELDKHTSVFCASEHKDNLNLWNQFGGNHEGFCVGLNLKEIAKNPEVFGSAKKVNYGESPPLIHAYSMSESETRDRFFTCLYSLPKMFSNENEFRLVKINVKEKENILPDYYFNEVILGCNIPSNHKTEILSIIKNNFKTIKVEQAIYKDNKLEFERIR